MSKNCRYSLAQAICFLLLFLDYESSYSQNRASVFAGYQYQASWAVGGYGFNTGFRFGRHELSAAYYPNYPKRSGIASYRFYFPKHDGLATPYFSIFGGKGHIDRFYSILDYDGSVTRMDATTTSLGAWIGVNFRVWRGLTAYFQLGLAREGIHIDPWDWHLRFLADNHTFGIRYDLRIDKRRKDEPVWPKPESGESTNRLHLNLRAGFAPKTIYFNNQLPVVAAMVEYAIKPWGRVYAGIEFSELFSAQLWNPPYSPFGFAGIPIGFRFLPLNRKRWSYFTDGGIVVHTRNKYYMTGIRTRIGHGFSLHIAKGISLDAMMSWEIFDQFDYVRYYSGLNLNPELLRRINHGR